MLNNFRKKEDLKQKQNIQKHTREARSNPLEMMYEMWKSPFPTFVTYQNEGVVTQREGGLRQFFCENKQFETKTKLKKKAI